MPGFKQCRLRFKLGSHAPICKLLMATLLAGGCLQARYVAAQLCTTPPAVPCPSTTQVLTQQQAAKLFDDMVNLTVMIGGVNEPIPYKFPDDGCWIRAHAMYRSICQTYASWKVWNYRSAGGSLDTCSIYGDPTKPACPSVRKHHVTWRYHVAPMVLVQVGGKPQQMVLDPSLFGGPVTVTAWQNAQNANLAGLGTLEVTIPEIWYHPQGSDNGGTNQCDPGGVMGTDGLLPGYNLKATKRAEKLGLKQPIRLDSTQFIVAQIQSFNQSTGMLQLVGSLNIYMLDMGDPLYPAWADFLIATEQGLSQAYIYVAYDPSTFQVQDIFPTFTETVMDLVSGSGGVYEADFVIHEAQFSLNPSNPGYSLYLSLLQQSYQNQTPLLISTDESEMLLDVRNVPAK